MFCCRELLFSKLFYRHQQQQPPLPVLRAAAGNRSFFSRISDDTLGTFFVWFWTLLVLQSHGVLLPGAAFFEAVLPASAAAAAATSSASSRRIVSNHRAHYQKNPQYNLVGIPHVSTNHEMALNCCFFRTRAHGF